MGEDTTSARLSCPPWIDATQLIALGFVCPARTVGREDSRTALHAHALYPASTLLTITAATLRLVAGSISIRLPIARLSAYVSSTRG